MAASLDRSQPYATVYSDDLGRAFEQDGRYFTGSGALWEAPEAALVEVPVKAAVKAAPKAKPAPTPASPADEQLAAQMAGA